MKQTPENHRSWRPTVAACYISYIVQAAVVTLPPLLFIVFNTRYGLSLDKIGLLVFFGFVIQILTDFASSKLIPKIGYRAGAVAAHVLAAVGLLGMGLLPLCLPVFPALVIAYVFASIGGGLTEVLISPIVDNVPSASKSAAMSLLHSFYCWGVVAVVLLTTLFDLVLPDELWYCIPIVWAVLPLGGGLFFLFVRLPQVQEETTDRKPLWKTPTFWLLGVLMLASGAAEQSISQWASMFAETALGIDKAMGDLLGMGAFAVLMGTARLLYGLFGKKLKLRLTLIACAAVNILSYLLTVLVPNPIVNLIGCALCGLSIGMAWPGVLSLSSRRLQGGTALFAFMALFGDVGCAFGPGIVGWVSGSGASLFGSPLKAGLLTATAFPVIMLVALLILGKTPPAPQPAAESPAENAAENNGDTPTV